MTGSSRLFDAEGAKALEAIYLTPDVITQRSKVLDLLAVNSGEQVLDVGVGPGLLTYDLARLVGETGRIAGIDLSTDMVAMGSERLTGFPQAYVIEASATDLPFEAASFDAAVSTQVYEYVADMPLAISELYRVLRPGGRAVILDTDWRSIVWHSSDNGRMDRLLRCWDDHLADPHLPSKLPSLLRHAGFEVRRVEVLPMFSPRWQPVSYAGHMLTMITNFVRANAARFGLEPLEVEAWRADQDDLIARDEFFFSVNRYAFVAGR